MNSLRQKFLNLGRPGRNVHEFRRRNFGTVQSNFNAASKGNRNPTSSFVAMASFFSSPTDSKIKPVAKLVGRMEGGKDVECMSYEAQDWVCDDRLLRSVREHQVVVM